MKHRLLGFALALALLASAGMTSMVSADTDPDDGILDESVVVTASVSDAITLTMNRTSVNFGEGLTFLGDYDAGSDVVYACSSAEHGDGVGARFLGPEVTATVSSSTDYVLGRIVLTADVAGLDGRFWFNSMNFDCTKNEVTFADFVPFFGPDALISAIFEDAPGGLNLTYSEYYALDVFVGQEASAWDFDVIYVAQATT